MTIENTIERLQTGNERYVADKLNRDLQDSSRRNTLTEGQEPFAIVLSCADSRVVPELVFDTGLGELFVVRVAGNIANTSSIASMEYAVAHPTIPIRALVVLGHESCGAVGAAMQGGNNGYNINHLLSHITPALDACGSDAPAVDVIKKNAELTAQDLMDRSPIIKAAVDKGELKMVPAYYNLASGKVDFL